MKYNAIRIEYLNSEVTYDVWLIIHIFFIKRVHKQREQAWATLSAGRPNLTFSENWESSNINPPLRNKHAFFHGSQVTIQ